MSEPTTLLEAVRHFADLDTCHQYMLNLKWPDGKPTCPKCGTDRVSELRTRRILKCNVSRCQKQFSAKVGTIFESSPLGLDKWFVAVWAIAGGGKITSAELASALSVEVVTAWKMLKKIRVAKEIAGMADYRILTVWPAYRVGDDGSVWTRWRKGPGADLSGPWREMHPAVDRDGYRRIDLNSGDGKPVTRKVSVLVCEAFHGPASVGHVCRHRNGNNQDDRADNLLWGTTLENTADRREHGNIVTGDRHGKTKLTESQISELLALSGKVIQRVAAERFGVSRGYVGQLWSGARKRVG